ncbi:PQQ-dependent sugar dehydrogenase [Actinoplanes utahensis]|uniref:Gluconolaconase n=1 Tax=Actinoplanes utahensis TaxID=1869 RepID=A0A0A6USQ4_ACTUT|nr:gluconolaconase [Actinoplanes utahensis]KHD77494.1 gluconolaconase [Actinoplanes utahensis]GIF32638.1 gluconolaconase [Actinoplanes utahensis]
MRTFARGVVAGSLVLALAGCSAEEPESPSAPGSPAAAQTPEPSAAGLAATTVRTLDGTDADPFDRERRLQAPPGWTVSVWARVPTARLLAWTPDGRLLVSRPKHGDVVELRPGAGDAVPAQRTLLSGLNQPHGLAFHKDTLYVAESDQVNAYTYRNGAVSGRKVVVGGLPDDKSPDLRGAYSHALKSVAVGEDGAIYISVGSTGNISEEDRSADPERATILKAPPGGGEPTTFARGVRNGTGLAIDPDGAVWTAVNHRDNIEYPHDRDYDGDGDGDQGRVLQSYVNDHPMEQLARLTEGRELGWPYCNSEPDLSPGDKDSKLGYTQRPFVRDFQTNADGSKLDCGRLAPVEQGMGAHSAPLGLSFVGAPGLPSGYGPGALVGVHGSWNRKPPRAPEVSFYAWRNGALGAQQTLLTGFQDADGSRWGRPVMAVRGPDGAIYVSDDAAGAIYRVTSGPGQG